MRGPPLSRRPDPHLEGNRVTIPRLLSVEPLMTPLRPHFPTRRRPRMVHLGVLALLAACSDGPSGPSAPEVASVEVQASASSVQVGQSLQLVATARDAGGNALAGHSFTWRSSNGAMATVDGTGKLSAHAAGSVTVTATSGGRSGEAVVTVAPVSNAAQYDIQVRYLGAVPDRVRRSVDMAVSRWRGVIVGDVPDVPVSIPAGRCLPGIPAVEETVDDLLLFVEVVPLNGFSGYANICWVRTESSLPIVARVQINAADVGRMFREGWGDNLVLHEVGHAVGMLESIWTRRQLTDMADPSDPRFTGDAAKQAFGLMVPGTPGGAAVPLENVGPPGTIRTHWRRSVFDNEIMTPYITSGSVLSLLTVSALEDIGYRVDRNAAQPFPSQRAAAAGGAVGVAVSEGVGGPVGSVDARGNVFIFRRP